jgi:hypothetical protein
MPYHIRFRGHHMETIGKNVRAVLQGFEEQGRTDVRL